MGNRLILVSILFFVAACNSSMSSDTAIQPMLDADAVAQAVAEGIEVTFTGDDCPVSGPAVLPAGDYLFVFKDLEGESSADLTLGRLTDGNTYQDFLDLQGGEPGTYIPKPDYIDQSITIVDVDIDWQTGEKGITYALEEGEYALYVFTFVGGNWGQWLCGPLTVVKAPSN